MNRKILFHGKRLDNGEWIEGCYYYKHVLFGSAYVTRHYIIPQSGGDSYAVDPDSVGQFTGMHEFVVTDKSFDKLLFEGDIVEVWGERRAYSGYQQSQYDGWNKVRAVIEFACGEWRLNYDNTYNQSLCKLRGNEQDERVVNNARALYWFGHHASNVDWYREHNKHYYWGDIIKIGNIYDNPELLEVLL